MRHRIINIVITNIIAVITEKMELLNIILPFDVIMETKFKNFSLSVTTYKQQTAYIEY